jgi:hypothetical protein
MWNLTGIIYRYFKFRWFYAGNFISPEKKALLLFYLVMYGGSSAKGQPPVLQCLPVVFSRHLLQKVGDH